MQIGLGRKSDAGHHLFRARTHVGISTIRGPNELVCRKLLAFFSCNYWNWRAHGEMAQGPFNTRTHAPNSDYLTYLPDPQVRIDLNLARTQRLPTLSDRT